MRFTLVAAAFTVVFAPYYAFYLKLPYTGLMNFLYGISLALTSVILHRTRSVRIAANWTLSCGFAVLLFQSWVLGGVSSLAYPWLACLPMAAMLLRGVRGGALFFIDLNDFKLVNDEHGHSAGDQVLREVALRLQDTVRSSDLVGRIGGDEFALIIEGVESQHDVAILADKVADAIGDPIEIDGAKVNVGASIGVAFFPDRECHFGDRITLPSIPATASPARGEVDQESVRRLLEKADAAMYTAKRKALRYWVHQHVADETLRGTAALVSEPPPAA